MNLRFAILVLLVSVAVTASFASNPIWLAATEAFGPATDAQFVPFYFENKAADKTLHGLAIRTPEHGQSPSAADHVYAGRQGKFRIELLAVAEEDGESRYRLEVNGRDLGERVNPTTTEKRRPVRHVWHNVSLSSGDRIRVIFRGASNQRIPEGTGFAFARGRWRGLELIAINKD